MQGALAHTGEPRGQRGEVADVTDAPTRGRRTGEKRDRQTGAAPGASCGAIHFLVLSLGMAVGAAARLNRQTIPWLN